MDAVTGAFGFSGKYIAQRLLTSGHEVMTLTNSPQRANPFAGQIRAVPFNFDNPAALAESLRGVSVLYNTYWVRFRLRGHQGGFSHATAVRNTLILFEAAKAAGVERIVHVSITNPAEDSPLEYFRGKAQLERALKELGVSYAILRPAVLFGREDILINNIAWLLRRLPVFGVFGDGLYRLQPIYVGDLAALAVETGQGHDNVIVNAIGPETFTYRGLVEELGRAIGKPRPIVSVPPWFGYLAARLIGALVHDVVITREEIAGLMANLLYVDSPPVGETGLINWARENTAWLGSRYASELRRRRERKTAYTEL